PMELERIILKTLAKNPDERYQHVGDLLTDLRMVRTETDKHPSSKRSKKRFIPKKRNGKRIFVLSAIAFVLLLSVLFLLGKKFLFIEKTTQNLQSSWWQNSIAVLPFEDLSRKRNQTYFCDGVTDDIISKLSKIKELKVINLLSVLRYRNSQKDLNTIAKELGVANILRGSLRKEGDLLHINVQLIKAENGFNLWGETYDFSMANLFQIQEQVATRIAEALQLQFSPQTLSDFAANRPKDLEIYEYSLKVKELINTYLISNREDDFQRALKMIQKMIAIDSTNVQPYMWSTWCYQNHFSMTGNPHDSSMVTKYIHKTVALNPKLAETAALRGWEYFTKRNFDLAFKYYQKALKKIPNMPEFNHAVGLSYYRLGLYHIALRFLRKAYEVNPFYLFTGGVIAKTYLNLGNLQQAQLYFEKAQELAPENVAILSDYVIFLLRAGQKKKAYKVLQKIEKLQLNYPWLSYSKYSKALYFAVTQEKEKALKLLKSRSAQVYALIGMRDEAMKEVQRNEYKYPYLFLLNNPFFDSLRGDPRFRKVLDQRKKLYEELRERYGYLSP
ncbi:MAG: hypothetical protein D6814_03655, partial [Calditrichaeota bacterium]